MTKKIVHKKRKKLPSSTKRAMQLDVLNTALVNLATAKREQATVEETIRDLRKLVKTNMEDLGLTNHRVEDSSTGVRVNSAIITPEKPVIDFIKLKTILSQNEWNMITSRTVDNTKLEGAISRGDIHEDVIADCTELVPGTSYVRVDVK